MSIPEYVRRRNSTMFVEIPPFGHEDTEPCSRAGHSWHPPLTPPREMIYHEQLCTSYAPATPSQDMAGAGPTAERLSEVAPALFSSPTLSSHFVKHFDDLPDIAQMSLGRTGRQQSQGTKVSMSEGWYPIMAS